ncbi:MAG TPA: hypothetical protein VLA49_17980 [Anaerolineales bacterium]|nr:hypothetical protein [Anaerolineales bacterium]
MDSYFSEIEGITSRSSGQQIKGWLVACPLTAAQMLRLPKELVYRKIVQTGRLAEKLGARILGLGAYTSVIGDAGLTVARRLDIPVTSGASYTVAIAIQSLLKAASALDIPLKRATAAVVGATGAIGRASAELLAEQVEELILIGRREHSLAALRGTLHARGVQARLHVSTDMAVLTRARLFLSATSSPHATIQPENLLPGCVLCDVAMPRGVSRQVAVQRKDVLVIDGGIVDVPGPADFHFDFGLPPGKAYACMAETMALALEGRFEDYSLGRELSAARIKEITTIAEKHGFRASGFRSFEKTVTAEQINRIRQLAYHGL